MKNTIEGVTMIIPAYNEGLGVAAQIETVHTALRGHGIPHEILVVDDASQDNTSDEALRAGARVLRHLENRGYGASIKAGIDAATYDVVGIIDADCTYPADQLPVMLKLLAEADMVVGARTGQNVQIPLVRRPAKWVLTRLAAIIAGRAIPDLNSGLRVFRRHTIRQYFPILSNRFSFTTTSTLALLADEYRVVYHPIDYYARVGQSKIVPRHFMDFIMLVFRMAMLFQPMKIFVPLALAVGGFGMFKVIFDILSFFPRTGKWGWDMLFQPVLSTSAVLLLLVGLQLLLIGMVADGALRRIAQHNGPLVPSYGARIIEQGPLAEPALQEDPAA